MKHDLYKTGDKDAPEVIMDGNYQVVLDQCRCCGLAEIELDFVPECGAKKCFGCGSEADLHEFGTKGTYLCINCLDK